MTKLGKAVSKKMEWEWIPRTSFLILTSILLSACTRTTPDIYEAGEKPIPPGIENQIHPKITTQDEVLALLGEPVARMREGSMHVFTYSYLALQNTDNAKSESLTITFDDKNLVVLSVIRGPL
jgi:outer membrane protein assembly factor BamE (lipoprotein component of BamABCDE complex)